MIDDDFAGFAHEIRLVGEGFVGVLLILTSESEGRGWIGGF